MNSRPPFRILSGNKSETRFTESQECEAFVQWLNLNSREIPSFKRVFHIPMEGKRHFLYGKKLQRMGMKTGFADYLWLLGPKGRCIFMEFKANRGKQSTPQKEFEQQCKCAGAEYVIHYSWKEAANYMLLLLAGEQRISLNMYNRLRAQLI